LRQEAARLHRHGHVPLHPEVLAPRIGSVAAGRGGVAQDGMELDRQVAARFLEQQRLILRRCVPVGHRRQRLDDDVDRLQGVLGERSALRQHHCERLAHIADFGVGDDRLGEGLELRQRLQPHRNPRDGVVQIRRRDDAVHARDRQRARGIDRSHAAVGHRAAQDRGVQHAGERQVVDILAAAAQKTQILQPLDRAADERVDGSHARFFAGFPAASFAGSFSCP
jgi:hypothetical protein